MHTRPLPCSLMLCLLLWTSTLTAQTHTLNLKNADIQALITTVSEITDKNFIVDPRVEGQVTVISSREMTPDEIYDVFLSVLRVHGFAAVPSGSVIKIVPDTNARQDSIAIMDNTQGYSPDELITRIIPVENIPAAQLVPILRPLLPQSAHLAAHSASNSLIISDRAANVARLANIIRRIDTATDEEVEIISLQNASAAEVARTLNMLTRNNGPGTTQLALIADERTNSILLGGDRASRLRMRTLVAHLDTPLEGGDTRVIYLRYADAEALVPVLESVAASLEVAQPETGMSTSIQAEPSTNALIITTSPAIFRSLQSVIRQLDIRRAQVLVEAVIAEVAVDMTRELGVQWQVGNGDLDGAFGGTNFGDSGSNILDLSANPLGANAGLNLGYINGTLGIPGLEGQILNMNVLIRALQSDVNSNVLSTPHLVTLDNEEAEIQVGQEVPFLTGQFTNTGTAGAALNPFQTIERKEVGILLRVTPHINEGDTMLLEIHQEVSTLIPNSRERSGAVDLVTNKRTLTTTVQVDDGQMIVLGGLISEDVADTIQKVPLLGSIPVVGALFRYRSTTAMKRNLMIFLRPTILRDPTLETRISSGKYNALRQQQIQAREAQKDWVHTPVLPELETWLPDYRELPGEPTDTAPDAASNDSHAEPDQ
ncbi:MAG: type II secretion system protein GspD [Gammaproteobacteria bacterium]|nr:MAG: type II secretion system protein GspD [Gammaproteobacteria bacterium]